MTVSRALRGQPGVSDKLRQQIQATAAKLGYRPDPLLGRLMHQLRRGGHRGFRASLCALTDKPDEPAYCVRLYHHAMRRAEELGFSLSRLRVSAGRHGWQAAIRTLRARGVEGVMLLPLVEPTSVDSADWSAFSVVAATSSVIAPRFHEVVPNHAANCRLLVERLAQQGFRRLGFVGHTTHAQRTHDAYASALAWHHMRYKVRCAPLFYAYDSVPKIAKWVNKERPDVVIVGHPPHFSQFKAELSRAGISVPWALANSLPFHPYAPGLDERHDSIGAIAMDTLTSLVLRGERGIPPVPTSISITGEWVEPTGTLR